MMQVVADDGFHFGIGAFETIAVEEGVPMFLDGHVRRLEEALAFLGISFDEKRILDTIWTTLATDDGRAGSRALKVTVTEENLLVTTRANPYTDVDRCRGFSCRLSEVRRNETSPFTFRKTLNHGECILEKRRCMLAGFDESIFLNMRGFVTEGATSNVFLVRDGEILTPESGSGLLPGVMRGYVVETSRVSEAPITVEDILAADEMFLTNSLMGIMPVATFEGYRFPERGTSSALIEAYRDHKEEQLARR